jgi:hypothetical protein
MLCQVAGVAMVKFTHDINEDAKHVFEDLHAEFGGKKYELLESMIYAFRALPGDLQLKLMSARPGDHEAGLAYLASLPWPPPPQQGLASTPDESRRILRLIDTIKIETPEDSAAWAGLARHAGRPDDLIAREMAKHALQIDKAQRRKRAGTG